MRRTRVVWTDEEREAVAARMAEIAREAPGLPEHEILFRAIRAALPDYRQGTVTTSNWPRHRREPLFGRMRELLYPPRPKIRVELADPAHADPVALAHALVDRLFGPGTGPELEARLASLEGRLGAIEESVSSFRSLLERILGDLADYTPRIAHENSPMRRT